MGRAGRSAADVLCMRKLEGQSRCVLAVDSEGASAHDSWSVMLFRLFKTQNAMEGVGEECLSRDGGGGDVGTVCSIWTNTTDLFVVPRRLSSLVLGSFYRRTFPLFSF